ALSAGVALADGHGYGSVKDAVPVAPQVNWNGLYIGAAVGYGIASTELDARMEEWDWEPGDEYYLDEFVAANLDGISGEGFQGILTLGYDRQIHPGLLIGIFGEYAFGDLKSEASINFDNYYGMRLDADLSD